MLDHVGMIVVDSPRHWRLLEEVVRLVHRPAKVDESPSLLEISRGGRGPNILIALRHSIGWIPQRRKDDSRPYRGHDRQAAHAQRHQDPFCPVLQQAAKAALLPQHRGEEPAENEKQRHPKSVDDSNNVIENRRGRGIDHRPATASSQIGQSRMQRDAKQHCQPPECVKVMSTSIHARRPPASVPSRAAEALNHAPGQDLRSQVWPCGALV